MPEGTLFEQLTRAIDENGNLTESTRKRLMLMAITEVYSSTQCLPEMKQKIDNLERKSIIIQALNHPKLSIFFSLLTLVIVFILFTIWTELGVNAALLHVLGF